MPGTLRFMPEYDYSSNRRNRERWTSLNTKTFGKFFIFLTIILSLSGCFNNAFYYPDNFIYDKPENHGLKFEDIYFSSGDKTRLQGWFFPAQGQPKATIIHFHGNA